MEAQRAVVEEDSPAADEVVLPGVVVVSHAEARVVDEVAAADSLAEVLEEVREGDSVDEGKESKQSISFFPRWR